jgi:hypothetical protein
MAPQIQIVLYLPAMKATSGDGSHTGTEISSRRKGLATPFYGQMGNVRSTEDLY